MCAVSYSRSTAFSCSPPHIHLTHLFRFRRLAFLRVFWLIYNTPLSTCSFFPALLFPQHLPRLAAAIHRNRNITGSNWNLKSNEIEDSGASALGEAIGQLGNLTSLTLNLSYNKIGDSGASALGEAIGQLGNLTSLTLNLRANPVGVEGERSLASAIIHSTSICTLDLSLDYFSRDEIARPLLLRNRKLRNQKEISDRIAAILSFRGVTDSASSSHATDWDSAHRALTSTLRSLQSCENREELDKLIETRNENLRTAREALPHYLASCRLALSDQTLPRLREHLARLSAPLPFPDDLPTQASTDAEQLEAATIAASCDAWIARGAAIVGRAAAEDRLKLAEASGQQLAQLTSQLSVLERADECRRSLADLLKERSELLDKEEELNGQLHRLSTSRRGRHSAKPEDRRELAEQLADSRRRLRQLNERLWSLRSYLPEFRNPLVVERELEGVPLEQDDGLTLDCLKVDRSRRDYDAVELITASASRNDLFRAVLGGEPCVLKRFKGHAADCEQDLKASFARLRKLNHPNVLAPKCYFVDHDELYVHLEMVSGGDMQQWLDRVKPSRERLRSVFQQLVSTIIHLHANHIAHRDLKLENVLMGDGDVPILTDFETARDMEARPTLGGTETKIMGTDVYRAPEMEGRSFPVDMWAFGVMLLAAHWPAMYAGVVQVGLADGRTAVLPLTDSNPLWVASQNQGAHPLDQRCVQLAAALLQVNPAERPCAEHLLSHPYFTWTDDVPAADRGVDHVVRSWRASLPEPAGDPVHLTVRRQSLVSDVLDRFAALVDADDLRRSIQVIFANEAGVDASGLTSEMFTLFFRGLCDAPTGEEVPAAAAASSSSSAQRQVLIEVRGQLQDKAKPKPMLLPSPLTAAMSAELCDRYRCVGVVLGRALLLGRLLPSVFPLAFFKLLIELLHADRSLDEHATDEQEATLALEERLNNLLSFVDLDEVDPGKAAACVGVQTPEFAVDLFDDFEGLRGYEQSGADVKLTAANRSEWARLTKLNALVQDRVPQYRAIAQGVRQVAQANERLDQLLTLSPQALRIVLCGREHISVDEILRQTVFENAGDALPQWFGEVLRSFTQSELEALLMFVGAQVRLPSNTAIRVVVTAALPASLPTSHTCFWQLVLPRYASVEELAARLRTALEHGTVGFGFV